MDKHESLNDVEEEEIDSIAAQMSDEQCGALGYHPKFLNRFASPKWLVCVLTLYYIANAVVVNGFFTPAIPTIEKRFSLHSAQIGVITSIYDAAACLAVLPVSYFGIRNRPRYLGVGMMTMGIGYIVFIIPHLIIEKYIPVVGSQATNNTLPKLPLCGTKQGHYMDGCSGNRHGGNNVHYVFFLLGMIISGAGCTPMLALGIPFIDDSVKEKVSPTYMSVFGVFGIIASGVGLGLAYLTLQIFVHPEMKVSIKPGDSMWVGAWWLGFAVGAIFAFLVAVCLAALPRHVGKQRRNSAAKNKTMLMTKQQPMIENEKQGLPARQMPLFFFRLLVKYKTFTFVSIWISIEMFIFSGSFAFLPKITSVQFNIPPGLSGIYFGVAFLFSGVFGTLIGGWILRKWNIGGKGAIRLCLAFSIAGLISGCFLFITCESPRVVGLDLSYPNSSSFPTAKCSKDCNCSTTQFLPVCANSQTYLTPCFAGCGKHRSLTSFVNCSCLPGNSDKAFLGPCKKDCGHKLVLFCILAAVYSFCFIAPTLPGIVATMRCVPLKLKSFAVGIQWMMVRVIGSIPGPILVGYLIDRSCIKWEITCDGEQGSCQLYDNKTMSIYVAICLLSFKSVGIIATILALIFYKDSAKENDHNSNKEELETIQGISSDT